MDKGVAWSDERIDEGVLRWFGYFERMEKNRLRGECAGSCSVGRLRKRWIDIMKDCLKKRGLNVSQGRRMVGVCDRGMHGV